MMKVSSNRQTKIKVIENGKVVKTVNNAAINYGQDIEQLKKMIEIAIRLSPQDPIYVADKLSISLGEGRDIDVDQGELEMIQNALFKQEAIMGGKIAMTVHVRRPNGTGAKDTSRSVSRGPVRQFSCSNTENQENKYENIMRPPSPLAKRSTTPTPGKNNRSVSRSRMSATPLQASNLPRGMSPARMSSRPTPGVNSSVKLNDYLKSRQDEEVAKEEITVESVLGPDAAAEETAIPVNDANLSPMRVPKQLFNNSEKKAARRQSMLEIEENKKIIEKTINDTWAEVGEEGETTPTKVLAPFEYYSEDENEFNSDDEEEEQPQNGDEAVDAVQNVESAEVESAPVPPETPAKEIDDGVNPLLCVTPDENAIAEEKAANEEVPESATKTPSRANSRKSVIISSATKSAKKVDAVSTSLYPGPKTIRPVYPDGNTLGESTVRYEQNLRSYGGVKPEAPTSVKKKTKATPAKEKNELSPMGFKMSASKRDPDGRPSIGTITSQWEFMRINFVNNSDEELEWLMVSKRPGSYQYAHRKNEIAEDKYFKSLYETEFFESKLHHFVGFNAKLPSYVNELAGFYTALMANPKDEKAANQIYSTHGKLVAYVQANEASKILTVLTPKTEELLQTVAKETDKFRIVRKCRDLASIMSNDIFQMQSKLNQARKDGEEALKNMEKWARREMEVDEYNYAMRQQEEKWMEVEYEENSRALETMRQYLPVNITDITVNDLQELYRQNHGCISMELAQELKTNKFLHWLITHQDDITYSNFLSGENKTYFENLEGMDIVELRALAMVMPKKFELDSDGRKNEWRTRFFNRLKQLVSQYRHEKVKGAWDPAKNARALVELPPLKPDHLRRPVYFYRTKEQSDLKLKQYDDKLALLAKKEKFLETAEKEAKEAKEEYDTVLKEMRDPDFIELYGAEKLANVKELAKTEWTNAEKKRKTLSQETARLKKSIEEAPLTREQFIVKEKEVEDYLAERGITWNEKGQTPVMIDGCFFEEKVIEKKVKAAAKFLSPEEEAAIRKMELEKLKYAPKEEVVEEAPVEIAPVSDGNATSDDVSNVASTTTSTDTVAVTEDNSSTAAPVAAAPVADLPPMEDTSLSSDLVNSTQSSFETPVKPSRKRSILESTNPHLLNTLNKMFSGGAATPATATKTPSRRFSVAVTGSSVKGGALLVNTDKSNDAEVKKELKKSKSKLLQRLLEPNPPKRDPFSSTAGFPLPPRPMGGLSFLDQIKARCGGGGAAEVPAPPAAGGLSFLDQIKARKQASEEAPAAGGLSFLDQIKARKQASEEAPVAEKPKNPMAALFGGGGGAPAGGGMSFLEQIKARRKTEE